MHASQVVLPWALSPGREILRGFMPRPLRFSFPRFRVRVPGPGFPARFFACRLPHFRFFWGEKRFAHRTRPVRAARRRAAARIGRFGVSPRPVGAFTAGGRAPPAEPLYAGQKPAGPACRRKPRGPGGAGHGAEPCYLVLHRAVP